MTLPTHRADFRQRMIAMLIGAAYPTNEMRDFDDDFRSPVYVVHESDRELVSQLIDSADWFANLDRDIESADWPAVAAAFGDMTATDIHQAAALAAHERTTA
jgi:hypothetical protein